MPLTLYSGAPMKHVLLTTVGSAGDVYPMLGLGAGLRARGHTVTLVCAPIFEGDVRAAGLEFIPLGTLDDIRAALNEPDLWHPVKGLAVIARLAILKYMRPLYEILARYDPEKTLVVASSLAFGARLAQEARGLPLATVHLQPSILMSAHDPAELGGVGIPDWVPMGFRKAFLAGIERFTVDRLMAPDLNAFRAELGLEPVSKIFSSWMNSPELVLGFFPPWFAEPQPDWPEKMQLTGFIKHESAGGELPETVADFLDAGDPPVVFTAGSANVHGGDYFEAAVRAVETLGRRAVLLTRFPEQLPDALPPNILHAEWVPMRKLLERSASIVHHGGIGTMAQALAAGIPQLVTPLAHDQFDNANRVVRMGVGDRLDPRRFTPGRAARVLDRLLKDEDVLARAKGCSQKVDFETALADTCKFLEEEFL
jgi:rhamnosyltransferase subunit B